MSLFLNIIINAFSCLMVSELGLIFYKNCKAKCVVKYLLALVLCTIYLIIKYMNVKKINFFVLVYSVSIFFLFSCIVHTFCKSWMCFNGFNKISMCKGIDEHFITFISRKIIYCFPFIRAKDFYFYYYLCYYSAFLLLESELNCFQKKKEKETFHDMC